MKKTDRVIIVANGNLSEWIISQLRNDDYVIGVDRAAYWLIQHGIISDIAIGDFDSVTREELEVITKQSKSVHVYPPEKDATDLELAIDKAIGFKPNEIFVFGAIGTRLDHSWVAIQLLEKCLDADIPATVSDESNECTLCRSITTLTKDDRYRYLSVLPVTDEISVSITGCAYPLNNAMIRRGVSLGVSNEICSDFAEIKIHKGLTLIIRSND